MQYLFEFSGEHKTLPLAELVGILEGEGFEFESELDSPGVGLVKSEKNLKRIISRPALLRSVSQLKIKLSEPTYENIETECSKKLKGVEGTFAIDSRRILGYHRELSTTNLKKIIAASIIKESDSKVRVDMTNPDTIFKLVLSKKFYVGKLIQNADRSSFESRHGRSRPFFSPISLHPKFARVMINLARVRPGMNIIDPFCGTGGILIEGSSIGLHVYGSDISRKMIDGTADNLEHLQLDYMNLEWCDVKDCEANFPKMDAVITDPPYGRSASTSGEKPSRLYRRMFKAFQAILKPNSYLVIMLPSEKYFNTGSDYFTLKENYSVYVHRSLTRYICVYQN